MPAAARQGDPCTGHGCHPPRKASSGSSNVRINGKPVLRVGDTFEAHTCGIDTHEGTVVMGMSSVQVNGKPIARVGDDVSCGSAVAVGSPNVMAGA